MACIHLRLPCSVLPCSSLPPPPPCHQPSLAPLCESHTSLTKLAARTHTRSLARTHARFAGQKKKKKKKRLAAMPKSDSFVVLGPNGKEACYLATMLRGLRCAEGDRLLFFQPRKGSKRGFFTRDNDAGAARVGCVAEGGVVGGGGGRRAGREGVGACQGATRGPGRSVCGKAAGGSAAGGSSEVRVLSCMLRHWRVWLDASASLCSCLPPRSRECAP